MTTLSKDEVVRLAREAGYRADAKMHDHDYDLFLNFYTLCRAPLVAEVERLERWHAEINADTLNAMQVEIDDWKARAEVAEAELARVREQEPAGYFVPEGWDALGRVTDWAQVVKNQGTPLYATPPQPAAQEPDCATTGVCVRSGLYASPPSAVPVVEQLVEQLVEALDGLFSGDVVVWSLGGSARPRAAIAAGQKFIKESGK